jgi:hypothetical protein
MMWQLSLIYTATATATATAASLLEKGWKEIPQERRALTATAGVKIRRSFWIPQISMSAIQRCEEKNGCTHKSGRNDYMRWNRAVCVYIYTHTHTHTHTGGERERKLVDRAVELMRDLGAGDRVAMYQIRLNLLRDESYLFGCDLWPCVSWHIPDVRTVSTYRGTLLHAHTVYALLSNLVAYENWIYLRAAVIASGYRCSLHCGLVVQVEVFLCAFIKCVKWSGDFAAVCLSVFLSPRKVPDCFYGIK